MRAIVGCLVGVSALAIAGHASSASMDDAPLPCRAQVESALRALAPAYAGKTRKVPAGDAGSLEHAIVSYVPPKHHPVAEGALPPPRANGAQASDVDGGGARALQGGRCPAEMANVLGRFCVDRFEGSLVEKTLDGAEKPWSPYAVPASDGRVYVAKSVKDVVPQAYVSAKTAEAACRAAGKRLCQPVEWRVACAGSEGTAYPYGATRAPGKCHDTGVSPMLTFHSATMKRGWGLAELNDPRNNQLEGTVAKTGAFPDCVTDAGVYDMVGNLHEWTADPNGTFQGGYWLDTSQHGNGCAYRTISHGYEYHDYSTGFRCCAELAP